MSNYIVTRANLLVFGVLIAIVALVGTLTWEQLRASNDARHWSDHTYEVMEKIKDVQIAIRDGETGQRGFMLTGNEAYLAPYDHAIAQLAALNNDLRRLTADNPEQQQRITTLVPLIQRRLDQLERNIRARREGITAPPGVVGDPGRVTMIAIEDLLAAMSAHEQELLIARQAAADRRAAWVGGLVASSVALTVLGLFVAARMLNQAWKRSNEAEAGQRVVAGQLRSSLDSLSQGVGVFSASHELMTWNDCFQQLLDLPRAMVRAGAPYLSFVEQLSDRGVALETEAQLGHGAARPGEAVVYERRRHDGATLELRRTAMLGGGFVLTVSDMTKRAQAEGVLREAQKMEAIGQLTGGIAHDFNNLLTIILGNLEFVRKKLDHDTALQTRIDRGIWASGRGAALTGQLLAFARKQPLAPAPIDIGAAMPDLVPLLSRTLGAHIDIRYVETAGLWPAMADAAQLENAVLNLALNARDAMPGGGRLTIELANKVLDEDYARAHAEVAAGDYAMIAVSDSGHGMTKDVLARVFEPFYTTKPAGKGTGLGLAMVFGFVKQSGGHVKVYSEPGEGTTVRMYLPRAIGAVEALSARTTAPADLPRGSATILVVEDEAEVREIAVAILQDLGYRVFEASDGEEGLRVFGQHVGAIEMVLTDVVLPGAFRGRDMAERIVAIRPEVQVLYMSGYTENSIVHHGRLDDGVQLISKPFKREQLARKIADILARRPAAAATSGDSNVVDLRAARGDG